MASSLSSPAITTQDVDADHSKEVAMAEFTYNPIQLVNPNQPVIINDSIRCNKGYVFHRNESGIVTLRGIVNNPNACFARYQITFNANIAVPEGGTAGPIAVALAIDGEPILTSKAIVTPAAVEEYWNLSRVLSADIWKGCCESVTIRNLSNIPILAQNTSVDITRPDLNVTR
jgi:hypothetical protein